MNPKINATLLPTSAYLSHTKPQLLLHLKKAEAKQLLYDLTGYDSLSLPHLPPQFQNMQLFPHWLEGSVKWYGTLCITTHNMVYGCECV